LSVAVVAVEVLERKSFMAQETSKSVSINLPWIRIQSVQIQER
jgi:hypothetical protein